MLREEHMDLFSTLSNGVYTADKAVTSSAVSGNVITIDKGIALWDVEIWCDQDFAGTSENLVFTLKGSNALSAGALSSATTFATVTIAAADLKKGRLYKAVLPNQYKYVQVVATPDTASSHAFTAGKIAGFIEPEFN